MRIYVASLSDYNAGRLHGVWIDLLSCSFNTAEVWDKINTMLRASPEGRAEEWAIHDHEDLPYEPGENPDIAELCKLCELYEEHGEAFKAWLELEGQCNADKAESGFQDAYAGEYKSREDWAYEYMESTGMLDGLPENLRHYFDYDKFANDVYVNGDMRFFEHSNGMVYVFNNN